MDDTKLNAANAITLLRIVLIPLIVWSLLIDARMAAFIIFVAAGISDAVDGAVARHFDQRTELGAYLDPMADKGLLVSVFVVLGYLGHIPIWLVLIVVSRDVLIITGVIISFLMGKPVAIQPLFVSKANTVLQIVFASVVLGWLAFAFEFGQFIELLAFATGGLTVISAAVYVVQWTRYMTEA